MMIPWAFTICGFLRDYRYENPLSVHDMRIPQGSRIWGRLSKWNAQQIEFLFILFICYFCSSKSKCKYHSLCSFVIWPSKSFFLNKMSPRRALILLFAQQIGFFAEQFAEQIAGQFAQQSRNLLSKSEILLFLPSKKAN